MECPYRFTLEDKECAKEECLSYIIKQRPRLVDSKTSHARLIHEPKPYCKLLDTDPTK